MGTYISNESLIKRALLNSTLTEELRDAEIDTLTHLIELRTYKAGEVIEQLGDNNYGNGLHDTLVMLGSGEVEVTFSSGGRTASLELHQAGEISTILGFVGGDVSQVSVGMVARTDCSLLMLDRKRFEALLNSQPAIAYYVMRGIVRYVHGIVRRLNMQRVEMTNYLYFARHVPHLAV